MNDQPTWTFGDPEPVTNVGKIGYRVPVSAEMLNDSLLDAYRLGSTFPRWVGRRATPEEIAATDARRKEREAAEDAMLDSLEGYFDAVTAAILELHSPESHEYGYRTCAGCDRGSYAEDDPDWPCRTIITLARAHHIHIPEHLT